MVDRPSAEEWKEWREGACGRWFFDHYLDALDNKMKAAWMETSWNSGLSSQEYLIDLRARASVLRDVMGANYEGVLDDLGLTVRGSEVAS